MKNENPFGKLQLLTAEELQKKTTDELHEIFSNMMFCADSRHPNYQPNMKAIADEHVRRGNVKK